MSIGNEALQSRPRRGTHLHYVVSQPLDFVLSYCCRESRDQPRGGDQAEYHDLFPMFVRQPRRFQRPLQDAYDYVQLIYRVLSGLSKYG